MSQTVELHHCVPFDGSLRICDGSRYGKIPEKNRKPVNKRVLIRKGNAVFWRKDRS